MISQDDVFNSVRRGYAELESLPNEDISSYFSAIEEESVAGHLSHIKGILFEQEYVESLETQGIIADVFETTNHPVTDIAVFDDGEIVSEIQLKATDSATFVNATIAENPDIDIVTTSEVASEFDPLVVTDSGIEDAALEQAVSETLFEETVNPVSPISIIGWFFGLPF